MTPDSKEVLNFVEPLFQLVFLHYYCFGCPLATTGEETDEESVYRDWSKVQKEMKTLKKENFAMLHKTPFIQYVFHKRTHKLDSETTRVEKPKSNSLINYLT